MFSHRYPRTLLFISPPCKTNLRESNYLYMYYNQLTIYQRETFLFSMPNAMKEFKFCYIMAKGYKRI